LQALLEPEDSAPTGLPLLLHSPRGHPPIHPLGPFSPPGQSAFHPFGAPLSFSPGKAKMPHDGSLDLPESIQGPHKRLLEPPNSIQGPQEEGSANEEGLEAVDGPAKRTRAQVSLAELTMEELETFLQVCIVLLQSLILSGLNQLVFVYLCTSELVRTERNGDGWR
jgi:hypothetical protein